MPMLMVLQKKKKKRKEKILSMVNFGWFGFTFGRGDS